ncbi:MAG TPA: GNAT family N-acetyltransferase [Acidimicrobiales bacterium]|nr:GNAT family N-acetyltransferase [Acidimicrobiales bacterium]
MTPRARRATSADLENALHLLEQAAAAVTLERGGHVHVQREFPTPPYADHLAALLHDPAACVAVGTVDDVVVGIAIATVETLRDSSSLARLEVLWVEPDAREVGLGEELIGLVTEWAEQLGATCLDAYALPGSRETKNFLEAAGFSARLLVMHRRLGDRRSR